MDVRRVVEGTGGRRGWVMPSPIVDGLIARSRSPIVAASSLFLETPSFLLLLGTTGSTTSTSESESIAISYSVATPCRPSRSQEGVRSASVVVSLSERGRNGVIDSCWGVVTGVKTDGGQSGRGVVVMVELVRRGRCGLSEGRSKGADECSGT